MKRNKKLGLLLLALVLVCAAAFAAVRLSPDEEAGEDTSFTLLALEAEDITQLSWDYDGESLTFTYDADDGWSYPADSAFPLDSALLESMAATLGDVTAYRTIEGVDDLSQYGLDEPEVSVAVATQDGDYTLAIGDETTMGGQRYASTGDGSVYLVDSSLLDSFSYGLYAFVAEEDIPAMNDLTAFTVESGNRDLNLVYLEDSGLAYSDHYVWFQQDGENYTTLDTELTESFIENITLLTWSQCVNYHADEETLAEYGLDEPAAVVTVDYVETTQEDSGLTDEDGNPIYDTLETDYTFVLEIGNYDGEYCYARIAGSDMVYYIDATVADVMVYLSLDSLLPDDILLLDSDTVESVDITLDGETYHVERTVEETTDEDGNTTQETIWTLDGTEIDFQDVFSDLTSLTSSSSGSELTPERTAEISFIFHRNTSDYQTVELTFYQYDSTSCLVSLNGETRLFVDREDIVSIVEEVNGLVLE